MNQDKLIITILRKNKLLDDTQIQEALKEQRSTGFPLSYILLNKKFISMLEFTKVMEEIKNRDKQSLYTKSSQDFLQPGKKFGPYLICCKVGKGAGGAVYKVKDLQNDRMLALKLLVEDSADPTRAKRFKREFKVAKSLHHPNIVAMYNIGRCRDLLYYTMDFIEGKTLTRLIEENTLSLRDFLEIIEKIARALDYAHRNGLIHRDIKPDNILVTPENEPKITDLGLAKRIDAATIITQTGMILGSPYYMSPEQVFANRKLDGRTDTYSLGIILYSIITHRLPFSATDIGALLHKMATETPPLPRTINPEIDRELELVCLKAIEKHEDGRYRTAEEMADDIRRYLEGKPVHAKLSGMLTTAITKRIFKYKASHLQPRTYKIFWAVLCGLLIFLCVLFIHLIILHLKQKSLPPGSSIIKEQGTIKNEE